jgi:nucleoside-diphosphate-sugar epimerase
VGTLISCCKHFTLQARGKNAFWSLAAPEPLAVSWSIICKHSPHTAADHRIDLKDKAQVQDLLQTQAFDYIYHLAALNPFKSNRGEDYFDTNVKGTENLLAGALTLKNKGKKVPDIFLASSALAYVPEKIPLTSFQEASPLEERALNGTLERAHQNILPLKPADGAVSEALLRSYHLSKSDIYYNDSKLLAEMTAHAYAQKGVPVKVGRLVNCYGYHSNQLMNQLLHEAKSGQPSTWVGKDADARDYLFCAGDSPNDDVVRFICTVAEKGQPGEAYNIASGGKFVRDAQTIASLVQGELKAPAKRALDSRVVLSNQKLLALGVAAPKTSPEAGIEMLRAKANLTPATGLMERVKAWFFRVWRHLKKWVCQAFGHARKKGTHYAVPF